MRQQRDERAARQAEAFARLHDWGRGCALGQTADGRYMLSGLRDAWTQRHPDGSVTYHEEPLTLPAHVGELRTFGGY